VAFLEGIQNAAHSLVFGQAGGAADRTPGSTGAGATLPRHLTPLFQQSFTASMSTVLDEAMQGRYEDQDLLAQAQMLRDKLAAHQAVSGTELIGGGPSAVAGPGAGAHAAPGASSDQRALLENYAAQAQTRLARVSASLGRFKAGHTLPSAASGQLDIHHFQPRNEAEAGAFAERLAIDLTEGAAQLEVLATQLDVARFDAANGTGVGADAKVADLEQQVATQQAYVIDVAGVVDSVSGNVVSNTQVAYNSAAGKGASEALRDGASLHDVETIRRAAAMADQEATTGNSSLVNNMRAALSSVVVEMMREQSERDKEREAEADRAAERKADEQYAENKAIEHRNDLDRSTAMAQQRHDQIMAEILSHYSRGRRAS
jgi:hypothetical protein